MQNAIDITYAANLISISHHLFKQSMGYFLSRWAYIPQDRYDWNPGGKAKTPIQIAAHVAVTNEFFARALAGNPPVQGDLPTVFAWMGKEEAKITSPDEATARLDSSAAEINATLPNLSSEATARSEEIQFYLGLLCRHPMSHGSQLDAYQLMWGDDDFHLKM